MHLIRRVDKAEWLTLYGWKQKRDMALQFRTEDEARGYASNVPMLYGLFEIEKATDLDVKPVSPGTLTDYDPFGYRVPRV